MTDSDRLNSTGVPEQLLHGPVVDARVLLAALHGVSLPCSCTTQHGSEMF